VRSGLGGIDFPAYVMMLSVLNTHVSHRSVSTSAIASMLQVELQLQETRIVVPLSPSLWQVLEVVVFDMSRRSGTCDSS
jgi:hypothetical protein